MGKSIDSVEVVKTDLEIREEIKAHEKGWAVQRVGVIFIFAFVLSAAAGLFGDGVASKKSISGDNAAVESQRFYRFQADMPLKIRVTNVPSQGTTVTFPNDYLQKFQVESVLPESKGNIFNNGEVSYSFEGSGSMDITFYLSPETQGTVDGEITINGEHFLLRHFIYP